MENEGGGQSGTMPTSSSTVAGATSSTTTESGGSETENVKKNDEKETELSSSTSGHRQRRHSRGPVGSPGFVTGVGAVFSDEEAQEMEGQKGKKRYTKRQWTCLVLFGTIDLLSAMMISLQAPFYPAEVKNQQNIIIIFIFGMHGK